MITVKIEEVPARLGCLECDFGTSDCCGAPVEITTVTCGGDTCLKVVEVIGEERKGV